MYLGNDSVCIFFSPFVGCAGLWYRNEWKWAMAKVNLARVASFALVRERTKGKGGPRDKALAGSLGVLYEHKISRSIAA